MTERDRTVAYEIIGCALAVLDRVKERDLGVSSIQIRKVIDQLGDIQCDLHWATGPLRDGERVPAPLDRDVREEGKKP